MSWPELVKYIFDSVTLLLVAILFLLAIL